MCCRGSKKSKVFRGSKISFRGYVVDPSFFSWVFIRSETPSRGYLLGLKFFSRGYFVGNSCIYKNKKREYEE